jgi:hypothetical protein
VRSTRTRNPDGVAQKAWIPGSRLAARPGMTVTLSATWYYCLKEAGLGLADVTSVAINRNNRANLLRKLTYVFTGRPPPVV